MGDFDSLICIDYSAAARPNRRENSIWAAGRIQGADLLHNFSTREDLHTWIGEQAQAHISDSKRLLIGFDFSFAYPRGFAKLLGLSGVPWQAIWAFLAARIEDGPRNANNRFAVADTINAQLDVQAPFWGRVGHPHLPHLSASKDVRYDQLSEWRAFEILGQRSPARDLSRMQPGWKLAYKGSVGSQALMGIARLQAHRVALGPNLAIWPFEAADRPVVFAEMYPSMFPSNHIDHDIKDARQVLAAVAAMAQADLTQWLDRDRFAHDPAIIEEEGWLLGF